MRPCETWVTPAGLASGVDTLSDAKRLEGVSITRNSIDSSRGPRLATMSVRVALRALAMLRTRGLGVAVSDRTTDWYAHAGVSGHSGCANCWILQVPSATHIQAHCPNVEFVIVVRPK